MRTQVCFTPTMISLGLGRYEDEGRKGASVLLNTSLSPNVTFFKRSYYYFCSSKEPFWTLFCLTGLHEIIKDISYIYLSTVVL